MKTSLLDVIRLAYANGGKIPASIPAHYVRHCQAWRRPSKVRAPDTGYYPPIKLGATI